MLLGILALALVLAAWVGVGRVLFLRGSRQSGTDPVRVADPLVVPVGAPVEVGLQTTPPILAEEVADHDVVLVIDHSGSMGGGPGSPLREAIRAAESFVHRCPAQIRIGLVGFDHEARILAPITTDLGRITSALRGLRGGGGTAIHSALERCSEALEDGREGIESTVILLSDGCSDRAAAERAAERLRQRDPKPTIICVGFGPAVDSALMETVAGSPDRYVHVAQAEHLDGLFRFLAAVVTGQVAVAALIREHVQAPRPFALIDSGRPYPIDVEPGPTTSIVWSVPVMEAGPLCAVYSLAAEHPGWHRVAGRGGLVRWQMPDGTERETRLPDGPRVLVLPAMLSWAGWLLNPLFWLLFSRFFPEPVDEVDETAAPAEEPMIPEPSLPEPLPVPGERVPAIAVRPALVIGLGPSGAGVASRLKDRLRDRRIESSAVQLLAIQASHPANRPPGSAEQGLDGRERLLLHQDLRPYVEQLRSAVTPSARTWIPWQRWLSQAEPLTTVRDVSGDRRKARLALLLQPDRVEEAISRGVADMLDRDGVILLVGATEDPEYSGMVVEVAHICASAGGSATLILTRCDADRGDETAGVFALERELDRVVRLRGDAIVSDRRHPPVAARKLIDRLIVLDRQGSSPEQAAADAAWSLLAYAGLGQRVRTACLDGDTVMCCLAHIHSRQTPAYSLWHWVRERTLREAINRTWLGLRHTEQGVRMADLEEKTAAHVEAFWKPRGSRSRGRLLTMARSIAAGHSPLAALLSQLPMDRPYHEQARFRDQERAAFSTHVEEWCVLVLEEEGGDQGWGMAALLAALRRLEAELELVAERIGGHAGDQAALEAVALGFDLVRDLGSIVRSVRRAAAPWILGLAGEQTALGISGADRLERSLAEDIDLQFREAAQHLVLPNQEAATLVEERYLEWYHSHGPALLDQLRFRMIRGPQGYRFALRCAEEVLDSPSAVKDELRAFLDRYAAVVLSWPLHGVFEPEAIPNADRALRAGRHGDRLFPGVSQAVDDQDPFFSAAIDIQERSLARALGVAGQDEAVAPFSWPEEANASRIRERIRNHLGHEPQPFSAVAVHLLRDTGKLHGWFADLARGKVRNCGSSVVLDRGGRALEIGQGGPSLEAADGCDELEALARRVVAHETALDGTAIPEADGGWNVDPEQAVADVEANAVVRTALAEPRWEMWRDVIRGLALEHGKRPPMS